MKQQQILLDAYKEIKNTMKSIRKLDLQDVDDNRTFSKIQEKYPDKNIGWARVDSLIKIISEMGDWCEKWKKEKERL